MPGRIRRSVEGAMGELTETADKFEAVADELLELIDDLRGNGVTIELELSEKSGPMAKFFGDKLKLRIRVPKKGPT